MKLPKRASERAQLNTITKVTIATHPVLQSLFRLLRVLLDFEFCFKLKLFELI